MDKSDILTKIVWKQLNLLRYEIILYLLRENPGLTRGGVARKVTGYGYCIPIVREYLNKLERNGLVTSRKEEEKRGTHGYKIVYSITDEGLNRLETYKKDIIAFLELI